MPKTASMPANVLILHKVVSTSFTLTCGSRGTGGMAIAYLQRTTRYRYFPVLWALRDDAEQMLAARIELARLEIDLSLRQIKSLAVTLSVLGDPLPGGQNQVTLALSREFPQNLSGEIALTFTPHASLPGNMDDPAIQFSTGGRTVGFTVPRGRETSHDGSHSRACRGHCPHSHLHHADV